MSLTLLAANDKTGIVDVVEFDTVLSESHQDELEVTEHPVELGSKIVDHVRLKPATLSFEGLISNTPIAQQDRGDSARAQNAMAKLQEFKTQGRLVTARTTLRVYENMLLTNLSTPREPRSGDALKFAVTLKEVRVVTSQRVRLDPKSVKTEQGIPKVDKGKQEPTPVQEPNRSIAKNMLHGIVGLFGGGTQK